MIDAEYFRTKLADHVARTGRRVRAEVHLHSGTVFEIEAIREVEDGYVVLRVWAPESREFEEEQDWGRQLDIGEPPVAVDRVALAYESISYVHLMPITPTAKRAIGFAQ